MVHAIRFLKCDKGHTLPMTFDDNECGCHHDGKPCIIVTCSECLKEWLEVRKRSETEEYNIDKITIPLGKEGMEEIAKLLKEGKR